MTHQTPELRFDSEHQTRTPPGAGSRSASDTTTAPEPESLRRISRAQALRLGGIALVSLVVITALGNWLMNRWSHVYVVDARIGASVITVSSETAGRVNAAPITFGNKVAKGDLLVGLDTRRTDLQLREIDAETARIESDQDQLRARQRMIRRQVDSRLMSGRADVRAAEAEYQAAQTTVETMQADFRRVEYLHDRGAVPDQQYDEQSTRFLNAQQKEKVTAAHVEVARAALTLIETEAAEIEVLARQIDSLDAQKDVLLARRGKQLIELDDRNIEAAFDGVVDAVFVELGEYVAPGTRLLMYHDPSEVWVDANVKETEFRKLWIGAPATVKVDAYPDREFKGKVIRLGEAATSEFALLPSPNPSGNFTKVTQRLPIRVAIEQDDALLRPGMMVELELDVVK